MNTETDCFIIQELSIEQYQGPYYVAEHMANHLNGQLNSRIIDIAAGTGHVASHVSYKADCYNQGS